jgi:solute:Na+ symporter, SSS family
MMDAVIFLIMAAAFIAVTLILGLLAYRRVKGSDEFLLGDRNTHPVILALSYGATFLSASAIVGFGGQSAKYGLSMIWLVFLNLFLGLAVAFIVFGKPTRKIGAKLGAFTFADFLGKRFKSPSIRTFTAVIVLIGMPIYCAAVLLGGVNFLDVMLNIDRNTVLLIFAIVTGVYVVYGGIIAVMYNDALQAGIMFVGMIIIFVFALVTFGGIDGDLTSVWNTAIASSDKLQQLSEQGLTGWGAMPEFGSQVWLTVVTTFLMGVGIGALAQPQLVIRFMTAKDDKAMSRSLIIGSIFMIVIVGSAYTIGAYSNLFFFDRYGEIAIDHVQNVDMIIPTFIVDLFSNVTFGDVFVSLFVLALLCASISTMSALLHVMGSSGGYDLATVIARKKGLVEKDKDYRSLRLNRAVTAVMLVVVVIIAYLMPSNIIAKATSIFMGLMAATLLPAYVYALYSKGEPRKDAAIISIAVGAVVWVVWGFFVSTSIATVIGTPMIDMGLWNYVDPLVIALPLSAIALYVTLKVRRTPAE